MTFSSESIHSFMQSFVSSLIHSSGFSVYSFIYSFFPCSLFYSLPLSISLFYISLSPSPLSPSFDLSLCSFTLLVPLFKILSPSPCLLPSFSLPLSLSLTTHSLSLCLSHFRIVLSKSPNLSTLVHIFFCLVVNHLKSPKTKKRHRHSSE